MPTPGRPQNPKKAEVLAWMKANDKGRKAAATHFSLPENTVAYWIKEENKKLRSGPAPSPVSTPASAPVTRSRMEQVNEAIDLRLAELLRPERIRDESSAVMIDLLLKLLTAFKLAPEGEEGADDGAAVASVLSLVRKSS